MKRDNIGGHHSICREYMVVLEKNHFVLNDEPIVSIDVPLFARIAAMLENNRNIDFDFVRL